MADLKRYTSVINKERGPSPARTPDQAAQAKKPFGTLNPGSNKKHLSSIHWVSPTKMVSFLLFGIIMSFGHHFYYQSRAGKEVGNENDQQNEHRFVSTLNVAHLCGTLLFLFRKATL